MVLVFILTSSDNQVDINRRNQVDIPLEAKRKSASIEADSSFLSFDYPYLVGRAGLEPATP